MAFATRYIAELMQLQPTEIQESGVDSCTTLETGWKTAMVAW